VGNHTIPIVSASATARCHWGAALAVLAPLLTNFTIMVEKSHINLGNMIEVQTATSHHHQDFLPVISVAGALLPRPRRHSASQ
jgi:hypothetical protein